jgi:hypothetical protein
MRDAMAEVESYRFEGSRTHHESHGDHSIDETHSFVGERGPGQSYFVSSRLQASYGYGEPTVLETLAVDGIVLTRVVVASRLTDGEPEAWKESAYFPTGMPYEAPPIEADRETTVTSFRTGTSDEGVLIYRVEGATALPPIAESIERTVSMQWVVDAGTYRLLETVFKLEENTPDGGGGVAVSTQDVVKHRLFDFGADIQIALPADYTPAHYADYTFAIEGEVDKADIWEQIADRLGSRLELRGLSARHTDDGLRIRLMEITYPPEQVEEAVNSLDLPVRLSLVDYRPPPGPHHTRAPIPTPTPTRTPTPVP